MSYKIQNRKSSPWMWALLILASIAVLIVILVFAYQKYPSREMPSTGVDTSVVDTTHTGR